MALHNNDGSVYLFTVPYPCFQVFEVNRSGQSAKKPSAEGFFRATKFAFQGIAGPKGRCSNLHEKSRTSSRTHIRSFQKGVRGSCGTIIHDIRCRNISIALGMIIPQLCLTGRGEFLPPPSISFRDPACYPNLQTKKAFNL